MVMLPAVAAVVPLLWAEMVASFVRLPSFPAWILILPPAPLPEAVLKSPVPGPEIETESAVTAKSSPRPAANVLLSTSSAGRLYKVAGIQRYVVIISSCRPSTDKILLNNFERQRINARRVSTQATW